MTQQMSLCYLGSAPGMLIYLHHNISTMLLLFLLTFELEDYLSHKCVPTGTVYVEKHGQASCHPLWRVFPKGDVECFWDAMAAEPENCLQLPRRRLIHLAAVVACGLNACWEFAICYFNKESYKQHLSSHCSKQRSSKVLFQSKQANFRSSQTRSQSQPPWHQW